MSFVLQVKLHHYITIITVIIIRFIIHLIPSIRIGSLASGSMNFKRTRKHSSRMRTARSCSSRGWGRASGGYTLPPLIPYPWIHYPEYSTPSDTLPPDMLPRISCHFLDTLSLDILPPQYHTRGKDIGPEIPGSPYRSWDKGLGCDLAREIPNPSSPWTDRRL